MPYVELRRWKEAIENAGVEEPVPLSWAYVLTGHLCQGSEYRRVTTLLFNDMRNRNFRRPTMLPDGSSMLFGTRFIYTAVTRAQEQSTLVINE
jgi:ATP-dependent exoDNAse (exonuclease V) alpha subunit